MPLEDEVEAELPAPEYMSGSMPEMMKHKASTAASALIILIERRNAVFCLRCLDGIGVIVAPCRVVLSGAIETLPGKTNERGTSS